ncbi:ribosomal RNA-processing protein 14-C-like [Carica papaya]|uniref:ribosomal RNA-processing protein 14-C-like n=1 Tax=Carica papaya TaxID=3649 RepID=UPI000B8C8DAE|nr:ribosomal RNA-processing protein 14-C-like [Carica papaya]XP_021892033.1 ribosomal RNA-processing protein 14-C-like [Carica papaya]XP_021892034.1 ribosomal RNA-processing protein 14-C-like [Carica papaya]XP_021892035.1 ribosomal RNA-processing protein 14-C-like [Carica papaya]
MGKKKEKAIPESDSIADLKAIIHQHSLFFDKLIELIPAKFYLPNDDQEKIWFKGLSKEEKASAKKKTRENLKNARRDRLDPEKSSASTLDLLKQSLEREKLNKENEDNETDVTPMMAGLEGGDRSVTYEELRQRLHRKIEELRAGRGGSDKAKKDENANKKQVQQKKRKRESGTEEKHPAAGKQSDKVEKDIAEASKELTFSHVKIGDEEEPGKKKKRKVTKSKELEMAMKLEEAKKDPEKGGTIASKHSWKAATSRAAGIKVHDDPKLLKQSMKKEKRRIQKNAQKWKERVQSQSKMKAEKQQRRSENIAERIQQKKMRRIAKREKKLLRPGFEGRKEGFINEGEA